MDSIDSAIVAQQGIVPKVMTRFFARITPVADSRRSRQRLVMMWAILGNSNLDTLAVKAE